MDLADLRAWLTSIPEVELAEPAAVARAMDDEAAYLASDEAMASLARDTYWPKWRSPWWSMVLLDELGAAARIPARAVAAMVAGLDRLPLHTFPLRDEDWPPGADRARDASCHCALGSMDRVLTACGVDVEAALPWTAAWYPRYQLADGGYTCDERAYLVADECPSSMVGTIAPLEAMTRRAASAACDRAAAMVLGRALVHGSATRHNAEERVAAERWGALCFPRFYFYDTLRGLAAVVAWATAHGRALPLAAVAPTVAALAARSPDGTLRVERRAFEGKTGWTCDPAGAWVRRPTTTWPLLEAVSELGAVSPALTRQWQATRRGLLALIERDQLTG
ncbi:MAG: hypothetical protein IPL61_13420 [Myxococcales bacterium]|nr:hypothetical protein [Myxococcales bacterium]